MDSCRHQGQLLSLIILPSSLFVCFVGSMSSCCTLFGNCADLFVQAHGYLQGTLCSPSVSDKIYIAWTPLGVFLLPCFTVGSTHCVSFTLLLLSIIACWDLSVIILSTLVFSIIHCEMLVYVRPA